MLWSKGLFNVFCLFCCGQAEVVVLSLCVNISIVLFGGGAVEHDMENMNNTYSGGRKSLQMRPAFCIPIQPQVRRKANTSHYNLWFCLSATGGQGGLIQIRRSEGVIKPYGKLRKT